MAQIKSVTSPKLKTFLSRLDANDAPRTIRNLSTALLMNDQTIDPETWDKIELLVHGPWVLVQVLQGENLSSENIDFVTQNNTEWGNKGKKFWEIMGGSFEFTNNSSSGTSIDITKLLTPKSFTIAKTATLSTINATTFLSIATALQSLLDFRPQRFTNLQNLCLTRIGIFIEFMEEYEKEDRIQNPEKYLVLPKPNVPPTPPPTPPPTNSANVLGIDFAKPNTWLVIALIFVVGLLVLRNRT